MDYQGLLALHLVAVVIWIGGMLVNGVVLAGSPAPARVAGLRRWNLRLVTLAMLLVWVLGITLAVEGGWFQAPWLSTKLVFVLALSAVHGMQSGTLRRLTRDPPKRPSAVVRASAALVIAGVLVIVVLAVAKPF